MVRSKIRLELRKEAAVMHPPLSISMSYGFSEDFTGSVSDKMQTKIARKRVSRLPCPPGDFIRLKADETKQS